MYIHKKQNKILIIMVLLALILVSNILNLNEKYSVCATNQTEEYNFEHKKQDIVGMGFSWIYNTKTLIITDLQDSEAEIRLPANSTIEIQGNKENKVKSIYTPENLTIKGDETASLLVEGQYIGSTGSNEYGVFASIYSPSKMTIESGNLKIENLEPRATKLSDYKRNPYCDVGIYASTLVINGGNIHIKMNKNSERDPSHAIQSGNVTINNGNLQLSSNEEVFCNGTCYEDNTGSSKHVTINGGTVVATSVNSIYNGNFIMNGGSFEGKTTGETNENYGKIFKEIEPVISATKEWEISYNNDASNNEIKAEITDINEIWKTCKVLKIAEKKDTNLLGDVNEDGTIDTEDAVMILKHLAGNITLSDSQILAADTSKDGNIDTEDAVRILKKLAGNISEF